MFLLFGLEVFIGRFIPFLFNFPSLREAFFGLVKCQALETGFERILLFDLFHHHFFLHILWNVFGFHVDHTSFIENIGIRMLPVFQ